MIGGNTLAQNTPANTQANPDAEVLSNGELSAVSSPSLLFSDRHCPASDNALISNFIQPSLGCTAYSNPCTTCPKGQSPALSTNVSVTFLHSQYRHVVTYCIYFLQELQASFFPPAGTTAMVPLNDPMVLVNGQQSLQKVNLYRAGVNQAQADNANASGTTYWYVCPCSASRSSVTDLSPPCLIANNLLNQGFSSP